MVNRDCAKQLYSSKILRPELELYTPTTLLFNIFKDLVYDDFSDNPQNLSY